MVFENFLTKTAFLCCSGKQLLIIIFNSKFLGNLLSDLTARRTKLTTNGNYCVHM